MAEQLIGLKRHAREFRMGMEERFDLFFAAAITGLSARKKHGTADDIARNAALIAMWAMGHKMPKMSEG